MLSGYFYSHYKFQFTPLREGRPAAVGRMCGFRDLFQFTPLREGRQQMPTIRLPTHLFQFTPLREGRPVRALENPLTLHFNSRPSARGDMGSS